VTEVGEGAAGAEGRPKKQHHRIEIVHESLLEAWPRLVRWQTQDEEGSLLRDQLKQAAHLWEEKGRSADLVWSGTSFREFELWRERYPGHLTALEEQFATAMTNRAQRMRRLRRTAVATAFVALSAVAAAIAVLRNQAELARDRAAEDARRAEASKLVALGKLDLEVEPTATLAYARRSLEIHESAEARRLVMEVLSRGPVARKLPLAAARLDCTRLTPSPDGRWVACSGWGSVIQLFGADGATGKVLSRNLNAARIRFVRFSDDSRSLATWAHGDPETVVWSVEGQEIARLQPGGLPRWFSRGLLSRFVFRDDKPPLTFVGSDLFPADRVAIETSPVSGGPPLRTVTWDRRDGDLRDFDPSLRRLVYSKERSVFVRSLEHGRSGGDVRLGDHPSNVAGATLSDGTGDIVSFDDKHEMRIWSGRTLRLLGVRQGLDPDRLFRAPVLGRGGTRLAWKSLREGALVVWDLAGPPDAGPLLVRSRTLGGEVGNAEFVPEGRWLASPTGDGVAFWPVDARWPRVLAGHASRVMEVGFSPDSRLLASCGTDGARVWPLTQEAGQVHPILFESGYTCYGIAMDPLGGQVLVAATALAAFLAPLDGGAPRTLVRVPPRESIGAVALDAKGQWAATAAAYAPEAKDRLLHVIDRRTGEVRAFPLPESEGENPRSGAVAALRFVRGERLLSAGVGGLRRWDPETGHNEVLHPSRCGPMDASADGRWLAAACKPLESGKPVPSSSDPPFGLLLLDLATGAPKNIEGHGTDISSLAISPAGDAIATGDSNGVVRVGRADGSEPHLLVGQGQIGGLAFSPDGRWLASASGNEVWLWPLPDLSQPPLHTLPHDALMAKLDSLTNVRVVEDTASPTGYKLDVGPFPGWKDVPTW